MVNLKGLFSSYLLKQKLITLLLISLLFALAWLSKQYYIQTDITLDSRNTLADTTLDLLSSLDQPVEITVYLEENKSLREKIKKLLARYQYIKNNIHLQFINPLAAPESIRQQAIASKNSIIVSYQGRSEAINVLNEAELSNTLYRLSHDQDQWLTFLNGHGERSPSGKANYDWGKFGTELKKRSIHVVNINLTQVPAIPDNSNVLIIASPMTEYLDGELEIILNYIEQGGNLLWVSDPDSAELIALGIQLGIEKLTGTVIDPNSQNFGVDNPTFVIVKDYQQHAISNNMKAMTVFPVTAAFNIENNLDFKTTPLFNSAENTWVETGQLSGPVNYEPENGDRQGPLHLAYALERQLSNGKQQRIVILGDGDFLSNRYLGNVGNQNYGFRIINWLNHNDDIIEIATKTTRDRQIQLSKLQVASIGIGFLIILPLILMLTGFLIWRSRKQK